MSTVVKKAIAEGKTALGIELGSTRIKAVLIGEDHQPIASGGCDWENRLENGVWTYHLDEVWAGLQASFAALAADVKARYDVPLETVGAFGVSGMMHGYLVFGADGEQLVPFRTWRNIITGAAAARLTDEFGFNIPQRWSIAHLYHAILNNEAHIKRVGHLTTLAGYVHWQLTGEKVVGVGEASGMFPVDSATGTYDAAKMDKFDALVADASLGWRLRGILPKVLAAGAEVGSLTEAGARLLDPTGTLKAGVPMCPPEGDAGTGMVATNSVAERTGNVSAGTSIFLMVVLEKAMKRVNPEIDIVATPGGRPVAMVHGNNCTGDLDAWVRVFADLLKNVGANVSKGALYDAVYHAALAGEADCGGLLSYNYVSGENVTGFDTGRPLFARLPDSRMSLPNFARCLLFSTMAALKIGMRILESEQVSLEELLGHGGLFKTRGVGQRLMAAAMNVPVTVMESAGEGGAWGIALLAAYMARKAPGERLEGYLADKVFSGMAGARVAPDPADVKGFEDFMARYTEGLAIERAAVEHLN